MLDCEPLEMDEPSVVRGRVSAPELEMQVVLERERALLATAARKLALNPRRHP